MRDWWKKYADKHVGYVIEKNGSFRPFIGRCYRDGDEDRADDCFIHVVGNGPKFATAEEALAYFEASPPGVELQEVFSKPVSAAMDGVTFLIEPYMATHGVDPRRAPAEEPVAAPTL
jgi:hypothetical protein